MPAICDDEQHSQRAQTPGALRVAGCCIAVLACTATMNAQSRLTDEEAADHFRKWLKEDVAYVITSEEVAVFEVLRSAEEKERFIEQFWRNRDPDPRTSRNEFREEHYRRVAYANEHFTAGVPGWRTDRGKIYIIHGPPDSIDSKPTGGIGDRSPDEGGGTTAFLPYERWFYRHLPAVGNGIEIEFVDRMGGGLYQFARDHHDKDALFYVPTAGKTLLEAEGYLHKADRVLDRHLNNPEVRDPYRESTYGRGFERLIRQIDLLRPAAPTATRYRALVSTEVTYEPVQVKLSSSIFHAWEDLFFVPISALLAGTGVGDRGTLYGWVEDLSGRTVLEFEEEATPVAVPDSASLHLLQKTLPLKTGRYKLTLILTDSNDRLRGTATQGIVVPAKSDQMSLSSVVLSRSVRRRDSSNPQSHELEVGPYRLVPDPGRPYEPLRERVTLLAEVYSARKDSASNESHLIASYRLGTGEEASWIDVSTSLVPWQDRHLLVHSLPLWKYPGGCHSLQVKLQDLIAGRTALEETRICIASTTY